MTTPPAPNERAARLREVFDRAFQSPPPAPADDVDDFLLIRVAGLPYAIRVGDVTSVAARRPIAPVPGRRAELLGLAGLRGSVVCVYSLAALLGHPADPREGAWLALCGSPDPIGLAFGEMEAFLRVPRADVHRDGAARGRHVDGVVLAGSSPRPIVDPKSMLEIIRTSAGPPGTTRSRP